MSEDKASRAVRVLQSLFMAGGRASGRTHTIMEGAAKTGATVVCHSKAFADDLQRRWPGVNVITPASLDNLRGVHNAVVVDHFLLEILIDEMRAGYEVRLEDLREQLKEASDE